MNKNAMISGRASRLAFKRVCLAAALGCLAVTLAGCPKRATQDSQPDGSQGGGATNPGPAEPAARDEKPTEYTLDNGLRVRLVPSAGEKQVALLLGVRAGFMEEPAGVPHLAHVTEHMTVFDLPTNEANAVKGWSMANKANGETLADFMYFDLYVSPQELDQALRVQAVRLAALEFSRETLLREIPRTLQEIDFAERSQFPAAGKFALAPFVQAALHGQTDLPIRARTHKITVDDVRAFHERTFRPDRTALVVIGEFDSATVRKAIDVHFGKLKKPSSAPAARPALKPGNHTADWDVATRHLFIAWPVPSAAHADHPALTLASLALMERLATDAGVSALGDAMPMLNDIDGVFLINVQAKPGADLGALEGKVMDMVAELTKPEAWKEGEVDRLRKFVAQMLMIDVDLDKLPLPPKVTKTMARTNIELQRMMRSMIWGDLDAYLKRLDEVKPDAVHGVVGKYLVPKSASIVRVQPAKPVK
ncbi:MAG: insulinase family protein [Bryobacteraceae bacterium]|nr:insulinase family protein [Bryobacteraceae bacterium]